MTGPRPPLDPQAAARGRDAAEAAGNIDMLLFIAQCLLSLAAGAWAASVADDGGNVLGLYAGVASAFALAGAVGAAQAVRFAGGTVLALVGLPGFVRKITTSPLAPAPPDPREQRMETALHLIATGVHSAVLLVLFLGLAVVVALYTGTSMATLAWRFALASLVLSLFTWRAMKAF